MSKDLEVYTGTLTSKGQITIPQKIREHINLNTGDVVNFKLNKKDNFVTLDKEIKECRLCHGEKAIDGKQCFACQGRGTLDTSKKLFDYFNILIKYEIYPSLIYDEIKDGVKMKRKIPLVTLVSNNYPEDILDKFKDELQMMAIYELCPYLKITNSEQGENIVKEDEFLNCLSTDECKENIKRILNPYYDTFCAFFKNK